jgi:O-antigen/teichoic acid export membrane protein
MLSLPASVGLALAARPLIVVLFGDRWAPAAGALQILAVFGVVRCFSSTTGEVWLALGRPQLRMHWEIGHAILVVPAVVGMTVAFGLRGAAAGMLLVDVLTGVPAIVITMRLLHLDLRALARALAAPVACAALLAVTLALLGPVGDGLAPPAALALLVAAGGAAFLAGCLLVARDLVGSMWLSLRSAPPAGS